MTQEELDSLLQQGVSDVSSLSENDIVSNANESEKSTGNYSSSKDDEYGMDYVDTANYKVDPDKRWPPPPPTEEHKVVNQLDDVTKDSEVKMTQIFDELENVSRSSSAIEKDVLALKKYIKSQRSMLDSLVENFPNIKTFSNSLEQTKDIEKVVKNIENNSISCGDAAMQAMDIMQYQDIHRQKIERVINVMRALSQYINSLFEGRIEDARRVSSANYIAGDSEEEIATEGDIEALIASFGRG